MSFYSESLEILKGYYCWLATHIDRTDNVLLELDFKVSEKGGKGDADESGIFFYARVN